MTRGYIQKKHITILGILSVLFLVASVYFYQIGDPVMFRAMRGIICFAFLFVLYFFQKNRVNWIIVLFLILYGTSSFASIWYDENNIATLSMGLNFLAFLLLVGALSPKIHFKKMNLLFTSIFVILVLVNGYLLYLFVEMIRDFALNDLHYFLIFLGAMSLVFSGFCVLLYNHEYSTKASLILTLFIFVMIFAEVFRAIAIYDFAYGSASVHVARGLLILAISLLVHYELSDKKPAEILGRR